MARCMVVGAFNTRIMRLTMVNGFLVSATVMEYTHTLMVAAMMENGWRTECMEGEHATMPAETNTPEIGLLVASMAEVSWNITMGIATRGTGRMDACMAKAPTVTRMVTDTTANGKMTNATVKVLLFTQLPMVLFLRNMTVNGWMAACRDGENTFTRMVAFMRVNGMTEECMEEEHTSFQMATDMKVNGWKTENTVNGILVYVNGERY
ncbi:putative protein kinase-like protein, partial [Trypanosoma cruzi]